MCAATLIAKCSADQTSGERVSRIDRKGERTEENELLESSHFSEP